MIDIVEILTHWYAGRSQHELAASLGVDRETLRKYTAPAVAAGFAPGGPPMAEADWRTLVCEWFPALGDTRLRLVSWPAIEPHRDYIHAQLKAGVTAATVHQPGRRARPGRVGGQPAPLGAGEPARAGAVLAGHGAAGRVAAG